MGGTITLKRRADTFEFRILIETEKGQKISYISHYPQGAPLRVNSIVRHIEPRDSKITDWTLWKNWKPFKDMK